MRESVNYFSAVLFDMDGVLIDSNSVIERGWREAAEIFGKTISLEDMIKHIHGQPGPHTIQALFSDLPVEAQRKIQAHIIHVENTAEYDPIPGVAELISSLHTAGIRIGIVTSGWREKIDRVTAMLEVQNCISVIVERDDVKKGKPFPDPYLLAAERLSTPPEKIIVFEDSKSGVTSAVSAGTCCIGIGGVELITNGARLVIPDFTGVEVLTRMEGNTAISLCPGHILIAETFIKTDGQSGS
ncbi:HAD family phosphatase [Enterobacter cancerogenus]|uniref:HAD family hydrolase n=1 Tax=Enterobacter cancerogenus TaxID=69218 RepID=UPI003075FDB0